MSDTCELIQLLLDEKTRRDLTFKDREEYYGGKDWSRVLVEAFPENIDLVLSSGLWCAMYGA